MSDESREYGDDWCEGCGCDGWYCTCMSDDCATEATAEPVEECALDLEEALP